MFDYLLELQELDTKVDRLAHLRDHLPELGQQAEAKARLSAVQQQVTSLSATRGDLAKREHRLEDEAQTVEEKVHAVEASMLLNTSPKELVAMQHEVDTLRLRQRDLEDEAIALMEQIEPLDAQLGELEAEAEQLRSLIETLHEQVLAQQAEIDGQLTERSAERTSLIAGVEASTLQTYDALRSQLGGIAVARFDAGRCTGCHLSLSAMQADEIRHTAEGELLRCPECGRLLVR